MTERAPSDPERVLILAPTEGDAQHCAAVFEEAGIASLACRSTAVLCREIDAGAGAVLLTEEFAAGGLEELVATLKCQPEWSDVPVLLLADEGANAGAAAWAMDVLGNVTVLERPVRIATLVSAVRTAIRARRHQYQLRDQLGASALLAAVVMSSDDAILSVTLDGAILSWNPGAERLFGYAATEILGNPIGILIPPELRDEERRVLERIRRGERTETYESVRVAKGGRRIQIAITVSPLRDASGRLIGASKVARDIGARKRAEAAASAARDLLRLITDNLPPLISYIDRDYRYRLNNRAYETWFGLRRDEIVGRRVKEVLGDEAWERLRPRMEAAVAGRRVTFEDEIPYRHGGARWVSGAYVPHFGPDGRVRGFAVLINDISERRRAEGALRESELRFRALAENIAQLAWMADPEGAVFWFNQRWYEYTGATPEETHGWAWMRLHHPEHAERVGTRYREHVAAGRIWEDTFPLRGRDGAYRWFLSRAVPIRDAAGAVVRWVGTSTDVTDQREAEERLRDADRRKDEFLATLSHELRNPLAPIRNSLHILRLADADPAQRGHVLGMMERQVEHLVRLVDDLLEVSRISRGKIQLRREPVELGAVLRSAVEASRPLIEQQQQALRVHVPDEPVVLEADAVRLTQVVSNLLNNAAKYSEPGGRIGLGAWRDGDEVVISVRDTGVGIPREMLPRVFDLFAQVDGTRGRAQGGLGIGLMLVRSLVEMHGGRVEARSEGEGRGSEFVVRLPCGADLREAREDEAPPADDLRARRVLVVDDNVDAAQSLSVLLELKGHDVRVAHDGVSGLELARAFAPEVILLDIGMPDVDGYEVARRVRREPALGGALLVALTGYGQEEDRRRSRDAGFDGHLVKPLDVGALERLLDESGDGAHRP